MLIATELRNPKSFALKSAMMRGVEDTLTKAVEILFLASHAGVKHAFISFIEMAVTDTAPIGAMNKLIRNSFEH